MSTKQQPKPTLYVCYKEMYHHDHIETHRLDSTYDLRGSIYRLRKHKEMDEGYHKLTNTKQVSTLYFVDDGIERIYI